MKYEKPVLEEIELQLEGSSLLCKSDAGGTKPGGGAVGPGGDDKDPTTPWG